MSRHIIHKNRNGCALHGALKVVNAIDGFVPIVHSHAGCSIQSRLSSNILNGNSGSYYSGWLETPSTAVIEKQVVFGGGSRLREQIKNTVKVHAADLYVVLSGCAPEIVGDDVPAMVKEAHDQDFPVISVITPGFKGNVYKGYQLALKAIIERIAYHQLDHNKQSDLVNILGVVPEQDLFWEGNLNQLSNLLSSLGLKANTLLGYGQTKENWKTVPSAGLNLVVSPWGLNAARQLEEKFGTPYLYLGYLPVGAADTSDLIDRLRQVIKIPEDIARSVRESGEKYQRYQFQKIAQYYLSHNFQKEIVLVGESHNVLGIARFLHDSLGQLIKAVIITDEPDEEYRQYINELLPVNESFPPELLYASNGQEIDEKLLVFKPELILGSSLERSVADQLSVPLVKISTPVYDQVILNHTYVGYDGGLNLLQDFANAI